MPTVVHPTAVVASGAQLGKNVKIGPHTVIGSRVMIGDGTSIGPQVVIDGVTTLGADNVVLGQASLGGAPQDLSYAGEPTELVLGDRNTIREFVTINRGTVKGGGVTRIGDECLFMACSHVAHDCELADNVLLANNVLLAGHAAVGQGAIVNGAAAAHQFVTIGKYAYIGGLTRIIQDAPPFMVLEGHPSRVRKVNIVGLERAGFEADDVQDLRAAFRRIWRSGEPKSRVLDQLEREGCAGLVAELVRALRATETGDKGRYRETLRAEFTRRGNERILSGAVDE